jgi:hypothetical protein
MMYDDDSGDNEYASGEETVAVIFTLFATAINPSIDKDVAYDILCQAMEDGGLGLHNAHQIGTLIKQTAHGVKSDAKH